MNRKCNFALCLALFSGASQADSIEIGGALYQLEWDDFIPITEPFGNRQAAVAYEATIDVSGDFGQPLLFDISGDVITRWFAGNMAVSLSVTCDSPQLQAPYFIGEDLDYGVRYQGVSYLAKPEFSATKITHGYCQTLTIRLDKQGHLSRQFYTVYTDLNFNIKISEVIQFD